MSNLPRRDDAVATWLKKHRDRYAGHGDACGCAHCNEGWLQFTALDAVLDDYRLHADVGQPLHVFVVDSPYREVEA